MGFNSGFKGLIPSSGRVEVLPPNSQILTSNVREQSSMNNKEIREATSYKLQATSVANGVSDFIYIMM